MIRAPVPEAAIHEDCDPLPGEHDVRSHPNIVCSDPQVLAEAEAEAMEFAPELNLRLRVGTPDGLHVSTPALSRGPGLTVSCASLRGQLGVFGYGHDRGRRASPLLPVSSGNISNMCFSGVLADIEPTSRAELSHA